MELEWEMRAELAEIREAEMREHEATLAECDPWSVETDEESRGFATEEEMWAYVESLPANMPFTFYVDGEEAGGGGGK